MQTSYSAQELAEALGKTKRTISRLATQEQWAKIKAPVRGGYQYCYLTRSLPEEIRIAMAAKKAQATGAALACEATEAGAKCVNVIRSAEAAERERRRIAREQGLAQFARLSEDKRAVALARLDMLKARDGFIGAAGLPLKRGSMVFCREYQDGNIKMPSATRQLIGTSLSWSTLNRWQQAYDQHGMIGLAPGYKSPNKGKTSLSTRVQEFIKGTLAEYPHTKTSKLMKAIEARCANLSETVPNRSAVNRFATNWRNQHASLLLYNQNFDKWRNQHMFAFGNASEKIVRLNQIWEFDSTPADVMFADGRHTIIGVLDVYSRRAKLLVAPSSRAISVAALTRRAIIDWGVPEIAKTDNGSDYVSKHMVRVFDDLEVEQVLCPPFTPENKPHIEAFFHTFSHDLVEFLPNYIGHNVAQRKDIEARRSFAARLMKQGEEPIDASYMTAAQFQTFCDDWCTAIYHQNQHSGLGGRKPADVARAWTDPVRRISDERALDILLCPAPKDGGHRTIGKKGILIDGRHYISDEFATLEQHEKRVYVLEDKTDAGTIYVFKYNELGEREYLCAAINPELTGQDRSEIVARAKALQKKFMQEGRKVLRKISKEQSVATINQEIMDFRKGQIANISPFPQRTEDYTTQALQQAAQAFADRDRLHNDQDDMQAMLEDLATERRIEAESYQEKKKAGIVPIFASMTERYQWIRDRIRDGRRPSSDEIEFLSEFYETTTGRMFVDLEGDLRPPGSREAADEL